MNLATKYLIAMFVGTPVLLVWTFLTAWGWEDWKRHRRGQRTIAAAVNAADEAMQKADQAIADKPKTDEELLAEIMKILRDIEARLDASLARSPK